MTQPNRAELIARVESATGPDREIDFTLERLCLEGDGWQREDRSDRLREPQWVRPAADGVMFVHGTARAYTSSLDAALALAERVLPDCVWTLSSGHQVGGPTGYNGFGAEVGEFIQTADYPESFGRTPALALVLATLRALPEPQDPPE